jgi:pescadillo protein
MRVMLMALQVVDRPVQGHRYLSRQYVQPQWVLDSANFRVLVDAELYAPGRQPPPHLSPFVDNSEEGYVPDYARTVLKLQVCRPSPGWWSLSSSLVLLA